MLAGNRKHIKTKEGYEPILLTHLHLELHCAYAFAGAHSGGDETNQGSNVFFKWLNFCSVFQSIKYGIQIIHELKFHREDE